MFKNYFKAILFILLLLNLKAKAQCGSCNATVSGLSTSDRYVGAGQTLCISATGTVTGNIYVGQAGNLCNAGTINSDSVIVDDGGTFLNYKSVNSLFVSILNGGFYNDGVVNIDSFLITGQSYFLNDSIFNGDYISFKNHFSATNNGTISVNNFRDSTISFTNKGHMSVTHNMNNESSSYFINDGTIYIGNDFLNSDLGYFTCNNYMEVQHDFSNTSSSTFIANCMLYVHNDWRNYSYIHGASGSCGGFYVGGITFSNSNLGVGGTNLDMCDAGHPASGIDFAWGWIEPNTTYCACNNSCISTFTSIKEKEKEKTSYLAYPNPVSNILHIKFENTKAETLVIKVQDMFGKTLQVKAYQTLIGENKTEIPVLNLAEGIYILNISSANQQQSKQLFSVIK